MPRLYLYLIVPPEYVASPQTSRGPQLEVEVVTTRAQGLHAELLRLLELGPSDAAAVAPLYAVGYRTTPAPATRPAVWPHLPRLGDPLPTLPLWLTTTLAVPVDLEASYEAACRLLRIE